MPFRWCALLSGLLFVTGMVGLYLRNSGSARAMSMTLVFHGALLLLVAAAAELGQVEGRGLALLGLGLLPAEYVVATLVWHRKGAG